MYRVLWIVAWGLLAAVPLASPPASAQSADAQPVDASSPHAPDWLVRPPASFGFDGAALTRAFERAAAMGPLTSLIVARRGTIVAEAYFQGMAPDRPTNIKSASKSVLSALVGIALEEGHLDSLDQPIAPFFPEHLGPDADPRKHQITLRDLLTMRAGLESTSDGSYGAWVASDDWVGYALEQPVERTPGTEMSYSTGTSHLVSAILTKATGMSTRAYAQSRLFDPLGIPPPRWDQDPNGIYLGGNNLWLSPRDLLTFGQLYLNDGRYRGQQVLPEGWARASTQPYVFKADRGFTYGFFWWTATFGGVQTHFAWGYGGQFVFVVPALDLVVVCTSSVEDHTRGNGHNTRLYTLMADYVLPAIRPS